MKLLLILNDPPYGTERCYNALRLAHALAKKDAEARIIVFLMADAVLSAKAGQKTPEGFYSVEQMLKRVMASEGTGPAVRNLHGRARHRRSGADGRRAPQHDGRTRFGDAASGQGAGVLIMTGAKAKRTLFAAQADAREN